MMFKKMSLSEAKNFYNQLKEEGKKVGKNAIITNALNDIYFFTEGLTKDYGNFNK